MAAPSTLAGLIQTLRAVSPLTPACRPVSGREHLSQLCFQFGDADREAEQPSSLQDRYSDTLALSSSAASTSGSGKRRVSGGKPSEGTSLLSTFPLGSAASPDQRHVFNLSLLPAWDLVHSSHVATPQGLTSGVALEGAWARGQVGPCAEHLDRMALLPDASDSVLDQHITELIQGRDLEDAFYVMDIGVLDRLFLTWVAAMPRVTPFYAVKCNPSPVLLGVLEALGAGFDCASEAEIKQVLSLGVLPERIIFANPCKMPSHIKYAAAAGVATTTFDSEAELDKIAALYPQARLLLRIQSGDSGARCPLGTKYGALESEVGPLLAAAAHKGLTVCGVSFHVGSAASDPSAFYSSIALAHQIFQEAAQQGKPMNLLDIGGGFTAPRTVSSALHPPDVSSAPNKSTPGSSNKGAKRRGTQDAALSPPAAMSFENAAQAINAALDEFFPVGCGVRIIAEPGRYFAETPATLATRVFGKRVRGEQREYWINDGVYGSMNCTLYDHAVLTARPLCLSPTHSPAPSPAHPGSTTVEEEQAEAGCSGAARFGSTVFGPTCDGLDCVLRQWPLPELQMGDWLLFPNMGAYTAAAGSNFNGFATSQLRTFLVYSAAAASSAAPVVPLLPCPAAGAADMEAPVLPSWAPPSALCCASASS